MKTGKSLNRFLPTHPKNKLENYCQQTMHALYLLGTHSVTATAQSALCSAGEVRIKRQKTAQQLMTFLV